MGTILDRDGNPIELIARDGLKFDQDLQHGEPPEEDEVEVIQYMSSGKRRRMLAKLSSKEIADKANDLIISCEVLPALGDVAIYARRVGDGVEDEIEIIADNHAGKREPSMMIEKIINVIKRPDEIRKKLESNDGTRYILSTFDDDGPQSIWAEYDNVERMYYVNDKVFDTATKAVEYMEDFDITRWVEVIT